MGFAVAGGFSVVFMVMLSVWGALSIPRSAKIATHHGPRGYESFRSRTAGLVLWPVLGLTMFAFALLFSAGDDEATTIFMTLHTALVVAAFVQLGAFRRAARRR